MQLAQRRNVHNEWVVLGAGFCVKDVFDAGGGEGACAEAVDGFGREGDGMRGAGEEGGGVSEVGKGCGVGDVQGGGVEGMCVWGEGGRWCKVDGCGVDGEDDCFK